MSRPRAAIASVALGLGLLVAACGSDTEPTTAGTRPKPAKGSAATTEFCRILTEASALLEPDPPDAEPPPEVTRAEFDAIGSLLARAEGTAPRALRSDIDRFATAIDRYRAALDDVGYDLGAIYSTPAGIEVANDTSHALSPAVVRYMTGPCGLSPNGGEQRTP